MTHLKNTLSHIEHEKFLSKTGFWGKQGAGSLVLCEQTKRFLFSLRSEYVLQPNTWGCWGGAIDINENPENAAKRELLEETGYSKCPYMVPLSVYTNQDFRYYNFLAIVKKEFIPKLNWEAQDFVWTTINNLPQPLHFGVEWVFKQDINVIKSFLKF